MIGCKKTISETWGIDQQLNFASLGVDDPIGHHQGTWGVEVS
jgi:hypothetical protein